MSSTHSYNKNSSNKNLKTTIEFLSGIVERVTYHNPENGFCVLRIKVKGRRDLVTVIGSTPSVSPGEYIKCSGIWHNDTNHGLQFKADKMQLSKPTSLEGIEKYLGSGLIKGIGPHFAKKLVTAFGEEVFDVIEHKTQLLSSVEGIGKMRASAICNNWQSQKIVREIMVFLQSHGVSTLKATRIYKTYGNEAISMVSENPYRLAKDIYGIGFVSADKIAANLGVEKNSLIRAQAGVNYVLLEATGEGNCGLPIGMLVDKASNLLEIEPSIVTTAISKEIESGFLVRDMLYEQEAIFLATYHYWEKHIAKMLLLLMQNKPPWEEVDSKTEIDRVEKKLNITLSLSQMLALQEALTTKAMVITGGPGTGKTTLINSLLTILKSKNLKVKLCAPTGRAAKRLSESTNLEALTIHRLLEIDPANGKFKRNHEYPLDCDYLVIDETSMADVQLFYSLLRSLPSKAGLLIAGDVDQLPSVGAGQVLKDIIDSGKIPVAKLTEIFRQAATSSIIKNAHLINKGIMPDLSNKTEESDFYFINSETPEDLINKVTTLVKERIPAKFKLHLTRDIQVLCPMQRGGTGVRSLNVHLQKALNPNSENVIEKFGQTFAVGDKVMQIENDYDKEVYNGDIGIINQINIEDTELVIAFDGREVTYDFTDLDQITLAYATTIHKSQGSEYPAVIIPLTMQSYTMLKRNLIYTAITRGKKLVIIVGQKKALAIAVRDNKSAARYSKLKEWLC